MNGLYVELFPFKRDKVIKVNATLLEPLLLEILEKVQDLNIQTTKIMFNNRKRVKEVTYISHESSPTS